jgi:adenylate kinase
VKKLPEVVVVTGTPGTGKTAISKALAKSNRADYLNLTTYVSKHKLYRGLDRARRTKIVDLTRTRISLRKTLTGRRRMIVIDSHIPEVIVPKQLVRRVFVLRCHPRVLESRLRAKKWRPNKIRENVLAEIVDSCLTSAVEYYGLSKVVQLDTSSGSVTHCVELARRFMREKPRVQARFDWFTKLEKGMLDRYLK